MDYKTNESWEKFSTNPQYPFTVTDKDSGELFISLGQPDGRLNLGEKHPFKETVHHVLIMLFKVQKPDEEVKHFSTT